MTRYADPPVTASSEAGVEGNSRLTAATGVVLTVLLLIEGVTILNVRGMITLHTAIGLALIAPVLLKTATTGYRFARYYSGKAAYVHRGPPHPILRLIGPLVVLSSLAVLGTGVAMLAVHGNSNLWLTLHKGTFVVWIVLTGVHFLGHIRDAAADTAADLRRQPGTQARRRRAVRLVLVTLALAAGVGTAAAFTPSASSWHLPRHSDAQHGGR